MNGWPMVIALISVFAMGYALGFAFARDRAS